MAKRKPDIDYRDRSRKRSEAGTPLYDCPICGEQCLWSARLEGGVDFVHTMTEGLGGMMCIGTCHSMSQPAFAIWAKEYKREQQEGRTPIFELNVPKRFGFASFGGTAKTPATQKRGRASS